MGNYHFIWRAPEHVYIEACSSENIRLVENIKKEIPIFHTRLMKQEFYNLYGLISPKTKPFLLRNSLTGDSSAARTTSEAEIDKRAAEALSMEDVDIVIDLRELNTNGKDKFEVFWEQCACYLSSCTSVHERRHDSISYMAKAISIRDLIEEVSKLCPADAPIPSQSWVQLNFCPRNPRTLASKRYTSRLEAKHTIQKRQFRKYHQDSHYCAAIFRYMRDYAIKYCDISCFVCIDDKHRIKVGEPNFPVAAVERGRVSNHETFVVGDHDFCKFNLIPSVILIVDIPHSLEGSWYTGSVYVGLKDGIFESSSPIRHATELYNCHINQSQIEHKHILFIYADGGPDYRLTYFSVQLSLIALFKQLNLDILIAGRTAPAHSWANPVESIMSIVNLHVGMQCIGVMRSKGSNEFERVIETCKNLKDIRQKCSSYKEDVANSLKPTKELISSVIKRLELKSKKFDIFQSASENEIQEFWQILLTIDANVTIKDTTQNSREKLTLLQNMTMTL